MTDLPASLAAALALLQRRLPAIKKSELAEVVTQKGTYRYAYANLAGISEQILPVLAELGLAFIAKPMFDGDGRFVLAYSLIHVSGERENGAYPLPTSGTPQAIGSAITYGRRYCLCAITGVAPEEDDDGALAEQEAAATRGTAQRTNRPRPTSGTGRPAATAQRTSAGTPPLPGEDGDTVTDNQLQKIVLGFDELGVVDRTQRLKITSRLVGRKLATAKGLTKAEAHDLIDLMEQAKGRGDPFAFLAAHAPSDGGGDAP